MKNQFLKAKPCAILLLLKDSQQQWYPSKLARSASCSYVHAVNLLATLREAGVVELEKKGRQNYYKLTERGAYIAMALDDFSKKCDAAEAEAKEKQHAKAEEKPPAQPQHAVGDAKQDKPSEKAPAQEKK